MSIWRWGLAAAIVWYAVVDVIRKLAGGSPLFLVGSDALMLGTYVVFVVGAVMFAGRGDSARYRLPSLRSVGIGAAFLLPVLLLQAASPRLPTPVLGLAGFRTYMLAVPAIVLGANLLRDEGDMRKCQRFLLAVAIPVLAVALFQVLSDPASLSRAMLAMDTDAHSFGDFEFRLIPATFASSKRFGRFLFGVYPALYALAVYHRVPRVRRGLLAAAFVGAAVISGSREIFVLLLGFHLVYWLLRLRSGRAKAAAALAIVGVVAVLWVTLLDVTHSDITASNYRWLSLLSTRADWLYRIQSYFFEPLGAVSTAYSAGELWLGSGAGSYGAEPLLLGTREQVWAMGLNRGFGADAGVTDAGISKLVIELGYIGAVAYMAFVTVVLVVSVRAAKLLRGHRYYPLALGLAIVPFGWVLLAFKTHSTISDGMMSLLVWLNVGVLLSLADLARTADPPPQAVAR